MTISTSSQLWPDRPGETTSVEGPVRHTPGQLSVVPALPAPPAPATEPPLGERARFISAGASSMRDLAYATALLDASERMHRQANLAALLQLVVAEASTIIDTDCAAVVRFAGIRRRVADTYLGTANDDQRLAGMVQAVANTGWLIRPGHVADLNVDSRWTVGGHQWAAPGWRSLMIVPLDSPNREDQMRLVWFSVKPRQFAARTDVAELFGRHANLAIRDLELSERGASARAWR